jgi:hypothetical protein
MWTRVGRPSSGTVFAALGMENRLKCGRRASAMAFQDAGAITPFTFVVPQSKEVCCQAIEVGRDARNITLILPVLRDEDVQDDESVMQLLLPSGAAQRVRVHIVPAEAAPAIHKSRAALRGAPGVGAHATMLAETPTPEAIRAVLEQQRAGRHPAIADDLLGDEAWLSADELAPPADVAALREELARAKEQLALESTLRRTRAGRDQAPPLIPGGAGGGGPLERARVLAGAPPLQVRGRTAAPTAEAAAAAAAALAAAQADASGAGADVDGAAVQALVPALLAVAVPLMQRMMEEPERLTSGGGASGMRGIAKKQTLQDKYRRKPGDRWRRMAALLEERSMEDVESFLDRFTNVNRDLATLYPATLFARITSALERQEYQRAMDLACAGVSYQEQLGIDGNVTVAWELTLEAPPFAVRRAGAPVPVTRKFPKTVRQTNPEHQFAQTVPAEVVDAVLAAIENWRTHQGNAEKIRGADEG